MKIQVWLSMIHFSSFKGRPLLQAEFITNFDKPITEFLAELSRACDVAELRFVRDIMYFIVKRRTASGHLGPLVERKSGDLKEKLLKDVYNLHLFGEGTITSPLPPPPPPKNMLKTDTKFVGLSKFCSILLSSLYRVLASSKLARRRRTRISYGHS